MDDGWRKWVGKKVFLETNSGRRYSGIVEELLQEESILILRDKKEKEIGIAVFAIAIIQEEE